MVLEIAQRELGFFGELPLGEDESSAQLDDGAEMLDLDGAFLLAGPTGGASPNGSSLAGQIVAMDSESSFAPSL